MAVCKQCGAPMQDTDLHCPLCGAPAEQDAPVPAGPDGMVWQEPSAALTQAGNRSGALIAPATHGEMEIADNMFANTVEIQSPIRMLTGGLGGVRDRVLAICTGRDNKNLLIAGGMASLWLAVMLLSSLGVRNGLTDTLAYLTFANGGGLGRSWPGLLGGLAGKATVLAMYCSAANGGVRYWGRGIKTMTDSVFSQDESRLPPLFCGMGLAMLLYGAFAGSATLGDTMAALAGMALCLETLGRENGVLLRAIRTYSENQNAFTDGIALFSGMSAGFLLAVAVSAIPLGSMPLIVGAALLICAVICKVGSRKQKEGKAK